MKRGYPRPQQSGGPLVTNHLHDLDMELELLKRKRLMIERQQQMLSNDRFDQQPYHRSQPQYDQRPSYGQSRNFSNLYDDGRQGGMNSQFGQNYQSVGPSWELSAPNQYVPQSADNRGFSSNRKAFEPKPRNPSFTPKPRNPNFTPKNKDFNQHKYKINNKFNNSQQMGNGSFNIAQQFKPKFVPPSNRPNKTGPVNKIKKDFNPTKVTKSKNKASYKLSHQPVETRRALAEKAALAKEQNQELILKADRPPSMKVTGRMELALGTILKELREQFAEYPQYFENLHYLREIKRELRLRLRKVLLGNIVPQMQEIVKMYRLEFPPKSDRSFLDLCIAKDDTKKLQKHVVQKFPYEVNPEKFFKTHFNQLITSQIDKMFEKLIDVQDIGTEKQFEELIAELPDIFAKPDSNNDPSDKSSGGDAKVESSVEESKDNEATQDEPAKDESAQVKTAQAESTQPDPASNESAKESPEQTQQKNVISKNEKEDKQEVDTPKDAAVENGNESKEEIPEATESVAKAKYLNGTEKIEFYKNLIDQMITQRLGGYLFKRRKDIIKTFNIHNAYRFARGAVLMQTNKMAEKLNKLPPYLSLDIEPDSPQTPKTPKTYFVKVVGKPSLPDKKVMKVFIDTFNPKTIKKHKFVNNLLFIGLSRQEDMEKILSANGTTVGNKKLTITISDKFHGSKKGDRNGDPNNTSADLENNISQLLSTIRNAEEENATVKEEAKVEHEENVKMTSENDENIENIIDENIENVIDEIVAAESENGAGLEITPIKEETETPIDAEKADEAVAASEESTPAKETVADAEKEAKNDKVDALKEEVPTGRATPTRTSARIGTATPSTVRTRRTSKLAQNN